jgi:hypothetical protein
MGTHNCYTHTTVTRIQLLYIHKNNCYTHTTVIHIRPSLTSPSAMDASEDVLPMPFMLLVEGFRDIAVSDLRVEEEELLDREGATVLTMVTISADSSNPPWIKDMLYVVCCMLEREMLCERDVLYYIRYEKYKKQACGYGIIILNY